MDWLRENLFWILVVVAFFWMHLKMHGGHGHGGHGHGGLDGGDHRHGGDHHPAADDVPDGQGHGEHVRRGSLARDDAAHGKGGSR